MRRKAIDVSNEIGIDSPRRSLEEILKLENKELKDRVERYRTALFEIAKVTGTVRDDTKAIFGVVKILDEYTTNEDFTECNCCKKTV